MTNIEELIKYLQSLPKNTEINVLENRGTLGYLGNDFSFNDLDLGENTEYFPRYHGDDPPVLYLGQD